MDTAKVSVNVENLLKTADVKKTSEARLRLLDYKHLQ